ncbi:hypothetical protein BFP97_06420 [Roseivirga sp. 4D4]|uniref:hypothetical protein n=1 Tax=Roseivirga sp. 4D4 TaxID=1889784 RepID=UPI000853CBBC|nr:hypothetical protein [Roseivirga sp. 4D4]OEK01166.1 hypothetical protein BFP97_06420 [Roseivirga sp. 4D4]
MKTYVVKAEMCTYLQVSIKACSEKEAERLASQMSQSDFTEIEGTRIWEIYNVEEADLVVEKYSNDELTEALGQALDWISQLVADDSEEDQEPLRWKQIQNVYTKYKYD